MKCSSPKKYSPKNSTYPLKYRWCASRTPSAPPSPLWGASAFLSYRLARRCATCRICSNMSNPKNLSAQKLYLVISGSTTCAHVPSCAQAQYLHFRRCVCDCIMIVVRIHLLRMGGWVSSTTVLWVSSAIYSCTRQVWDILGVVGIFSSLAPQKQFSSNMAGYLQITHVRYSCDTWTLNCGVGKRLRDENPTLAVKTCALELRCFRCVYANMIYW